jgi:hypothetical protein
VGFLLSRQLFQDFAIPLHTLYVGLEIRLAGFFLVILDSLLFLRVRSHGFLSFEKIEATFYSPERSLSRSERSQESTAVG